MYDIRENILQQREMQKARLRNHFTKAFDYQENFNGKNVESLDIQDEAAETCKAEEYSDFGIPKYGDIEKGGDRIWNGDEYVSAQDFLFKARVSKHQVGDIHPQHPNWIWTEYAPGKFDWKSKSGKHHKGKSDNTTSAASQSTPSASTSTQTTSTASSTVKNLQTQNNQNDKKPTTSQQSNTEEGTKLDWKNLTVTELKDGGLYTAADPKRRVITIGSKQYRADWDNEALLHLTSGVKVKSTDVAVERFKKLLEENKKKSTKSS